MHHFSSKDLGDRDGECAKEWFVTFPDMYFQFRVFLPSGHNARLRPCAASVAQKPCPHSLMTPDCPLFAPKELKHSLHQLLGTQPATLNCNRTSTGLSSDEGRSQFVGGDRAEQGAPDISIALPCPPTES